MTIESFDQVTQYPLCWRPGQPRSVNRAPGSFKTTLAKAESEIEDEMRRMRVPRWLVSRVPRHVGGAADPGCALWFEVERRTGRQLRVLACDKWLTQAANLHAIALSLESLRGLERWGAYTVEQAIEGARLALPAPDAPSGPPWWTVLGVERSWPLAAIVAVGKTKLEKAHPDREGGSTEAASAITVALAAAKKEKGG